MLPIRSNGRSSHRSTLGSLKLDFIARLEHGISSVCNLGNAISVLSFQTQIFICTLVDC